MCFVMLMFNESVTFSLIDPIPPPEQRERADEGAREGSEREGGALQ